MEALAGELLRDPVVRARLLTLVREAFAAAVQHLREDPPPENPFANETFTF